MSGWPGGREFSAFQPRHENARFHLGLLVLENPVGVLARLGMARAYRLMGDFRKARIAYKDFFVQFEEADPDIPILQQAKAEYAKLE